MTDEEINRKFDVVADLMASLAVKLDGLSDKINGLSDRTGELAEAQRRADERWGRTEDGIRALLAIAEIHEREIASTDERLSALINTVERIISERRDKP